MVQTREDAGFAHFYASVLSAFRAPTGRGGDGGHKAEQIDHLLGTLKPRVLIFDEFYNALRGGPRYVEAVLAWAPFAHADLAPQHLCSPCGFDLRAAARISITAAARRLERSIDDFSKAQIAKRSPAIHD